MVRQLLSDDESGNLVSADFQILEPRPFLSAVDENMGKIVAWIEMQIRQHLTCRIADVQERKDTSVLVGFGDVILAGAEVCDTQLRQRWRRIQAPRCQSSRRYLALRNQRSEPSFPELK
jgi:hypothetical protein